MSYIYPFVSTMTSSLNSGSYLNQKDYDLFSTGNKSDFWFGLSPKDAIEFSAYDLDTNLIVWNSKENLGHYNENTLTYYDEKNSQVYYTYKEFIFDYPQYNKDKILVNPVLDVSDSNLSSGSYILSYQFVRYMAGGPNNPLTIKDISPNKKEIKLIPSKEVDIPYTAFCVDKIPLYYVSPLYLTLTKECPYDQLYKKSQVENKQQIDFIKNLFFIPSDGKFVEFLETLYKDYVKYYRNTTQIDAGIGVETTIRIQGIQTYFSNFLISNGDKIYSFDEIKTGFKKSVENRLNILFETYTSDIYAPAKEYLLNLFADEYFPPIHEFLQKEYFEKYSSPLKNALFSNNGVYFPIISTGYIDERENDTDPLTLLVKLQNPISNEFSIKSSVWVSNIAMVPFLFNSIITNDITGKTIKISPADFTADSKEISFARSNKYYNSSDLNEGVDSDEVDVSKKINELNVDYTSFRNFIVFSSAEIRHNIFKNKMLVLSGVIESLAVLETKYEESGYSYQYYTEEKENLINKQSEIIQSFDGFESYLYKTGNYNYNSTTKTFNNQSFVNELDVESKTYDKNNRDSLVNNTPEHIILDKDNDEYLIFLSMIGHYFDNLYLYIKSLPSQRVIEDVYEFSRKILEEILTSFGWKNDASLESLNIIDNFLDASQAAINEFSAEERIRIIWNRILQNLPIIYKTKGVEECVRLVLSCYGIPSTLINVREYGGIDYTGGDRTSYSIDEKIFMLTFRGDGEYLYVPQHPSIKTIEFKVALDPNKIYKFGQEIPLLIKLGYSPSSLNYTIGVYKEPGKYLGRIYFKLNGKTILSDSIPIFNGEIFNVMVRRNYPDPLFEYNSTPDLVPTTYDFWVQRREDSRCIFSYKASQVFFKEDNISFSNTGMFLFGNQQTPTLFSGMLDKILLWTVPISDETYTDHCNNINSYSYIGSEKPHEVLYFRMNYDYPEDFSLHPSYVIKNRNEYYPGINGLAANFKVMSYSASIDNCIPVSHSVYPYQFQEISYNQTYTITSYGPNRFKNEKVNKTELELSGRLDVDGRSTYVPNTFVSPDSNQIGLFADPNQYKNKDIFRYLGDAGIVKTIADPSQMYDDRYYPLRNINYLYNESGNKRTLYNELLNLYRFYFDKSIFEVIKQIIPARNVLLTGILIEPTVLERPKYQYKYIGTKLCESETTSSTDILPVTTTEGNRPTISGMDSVYSAGEISSDIIYANISGSGKHTGFDMDLTFVGDPTIEYPATYNSGIINDISNREELGIHCDKTGKVLESIQTWEYPRYMVKKWERDSVYNRIGDYSKPQSMSSQSIYLYKTEFWDEVYYTNMVYLTSTDVVVPASYYLLPPDKNPNYSPKSSLQSYGLVYKHDASTFKQRPNTKKSNVFGKRNVEYNITEFSGKTFLSIKRVYINVFQQQSEQYYEIVGGYPRNHLTHKRIQFSPESFSESQYGKNKKITYNRYIKSRQTIDTTINVDKLQDNSLPVETINVSNINVVKSDNVLNK